MLSKKYILILVFISSLLVGCGGGAGSTGTSTSVDIGNLTTGDSYGSSVTGDRADYNVSVMVGGYPIINAKLSNTARVSNGYGLYFQLPVCKSFTELGNGKYTLNECSQKPNFVTAVGGFFDINGDGLLDANEPMQYSPLIVYTAVLLDTDLTITPLSTLVAGFASSSSYNPGALTITLGFTRREYAFRDTPDNVFMNQTMELVLSAAASSGIDMKILSADLATRMIASSGTGLDNLKSSISSLVNAQESKIAYGDAKIQSFWNDSRIKAVINGTDAMSALIAKKVPNTSIRITGLVTTYLTGANIVSGARIRLYVGTTQVGSGISDRYGKYSIEVNETSIPKDKTLFITAETQTLKLTSSIPTNVLLDKRVNGSIDATQIGGLALSYVTTLFNDNNNSIQSGATVKKLLFDASSYLNKDVNNSTFLIPLKGWTAPYLLPAGANAPIDTDFLTKFAQTLPVTSVPYLIDIESWPIPYATSDINDTIVKDSVAKYVLVMKTLKMARPDLKFGLWSVIPNVSVYEPIPTPLTLARAEHLYTLTLPIAEFVDFLAPNLYSGWTDQNKFISDYEQVFPMARRYNKPIIPFIWPEYDIVPSIPYGTYISDANWKSIIMLTRDKGDGIVLWGGPNYALPENDPNYRRTWSNTISWWTILKSEMGF
jgi:hypothetical protein